MNRGTKMQKTNKKFNLPKKPSNSKSISKDDVKAGNIVSINDKKTRGHKAIITRRHKKDRKKEQVLHIPITHAPNTRKLLNIRLTKNPEKEKTEPAYILPKVQKAKDKSLGKKHSNVVIKNSTDKSIIRHIKKQKKR